MSFSGVTKVVLRDNVFLETISLPCVPLRYSMPLGVVRRGRSAFFRVYGGSRLYSILAEWRPNCMFLLYPVSPVSYIESILHTLEQSIAWPGIPLPDPELGFWYKCNNIALNIDYGTYSLYQCEIQNLGGNIVGAYIRSMGCIIEALIHATKVAAGVEDLDDNLITKMYRCVARAGDQNLVPRLRRAMHRLLGAMYKKRASENNVSPYN